jgi:pimeloyl-ACP methyl ester carboxylesterase
MEVTLQLTEKYYQVNGIRMHTVESGPDDGPVVIFLHGFPEFWYGWRRQMAFLPNGATAWWCPTSGVTT